MKKIFVGLSFVLFSILCYSQVAFAVCSNTDRRFCVNAGTSDVDFVATRYYYLTTSSTTTFETTNLSSGGDTVMVLVNVSSGEVVCSDDDSGTSSYASKIEVGQGGCVLQSSGTYLLMVFSYSEQSSGKCDLSVDQQIESTGVSFGGHRWTGINVETNSSFQTANVSEKGQDVLDTVLILGSSTSNYIRGDDDGGLVEYSSKVKTGNFQFSNGIIVVGRIHAPFASMTGTGGLAVYYNDVENSMYDKSTLGQVCYNNKDSDCDGLGNALEESIGTCPCIDGNPLYPTCALLNNPSCPMTSNPKDSDGDGLPDSWEVFGRTTTSWPDQVLAYDFQLSRFGADPRHKDYFLEVDWVFGQANPNETLPVSQTTIEKVIQAYAKGKAADLKNPDGKDGIRLHFDVSGLSNTSMFSAQGNYIGGYGDWGGSGYTPDNGSTSGEQAYFTRESNMDPGRRGIFGYVLVDKRYGVSSAAAFTNLMHFNYTGNADSSLTVAHEMGHMLGISHWGASGDPAPYNYKPNYMSIMNYAYYNTPGNGLEFSEGNLPTLDPASLDENNAPQDTNLRAKWFGWLSSRFFLTADFFSGNVNWNRDVDTQGNPVYSNTNVKYPVFKDQDAVKEIFSEGKFTLPSTIDVATEYGSTLFSYLGRLYIFYVDKQTSKIAFVKSYDDGSTWSTPIKSSITAHSTLKIQLFGYESGTTYESRLAILYRLDDSNGDSYIQIAYMNEFEYMARPFNINPASSSQAYVLPTTGDYPPSAFVYANRLYVFYRNSTKNLFCRVLKADWTWETFQSGGSSVYDLSLKFKTSPNTSGSSPLVGDGQPSFLQLNGNLYMFLNRPLSTPLIPGAPPRILSRLVFDTTTNDTWILEEDLNFDVPVDSELSISYDSNGNIFYFNFFQEINAVRTVALGHSHSNSTKLFNFDSATPPQFFRPFTVVEQNVSSSTKISTVFHNNKVLSLVSNVVSGARTQELYPNASLTQHSPASDWNDWILMEEHLCRTANAIILTLSSDPYYIAGQGLCTP